MTVRWGVLSQRSGWPLSPATSLDTWWRQSSAGSGDAGAAAAASLALAHSQQGLGPLSGQERAQVLLLDDELIASSNQDAAEGTLLQESGLILPESAQSLPDESEQREEQPSALILPVVALPLADAYEQIEEDIGAEVIPCADVRRESCTANVGSNWHAACPQGALSAQQGEGSITKGAGSNGASFLASGFECSMQEDILTRPYTVRGVSPIG